MANNIIVSSDLSLFNKFEYMFIKESYFMGAEYGFKNKFINMLEDKSKVQPKYFEGKPESRFYGFSKSCMSFTAEELQFVMFCKFGLKPSEYEVVGVGWQTEMYNFQTQESMYGYCYDYCIVPKGASQFQNYRDFCVMGVYIDTLENQIEWVWGEGEDDNYYLGISTVRNFIKAASKVALFSVDISCDYDKPTNLTPGWCSNQTYMVEIDESGFLDSLSKDQFGGVSVSSKFVDSTNTIRIRETATLDKILGWGGGIRFNNKFTFNNCRKQSLKAVLKRLLEISWM